MATTITVVVVEEVFNVSVEGTIITASKTINPVTVKVVTVMWKEGDAIELKVLAMEAAVIIAIINLSHFIIQHKRLA